MKPHPVLPLTCGPCTHQCNQGRLCPRSLHRVLSSDEVTRAEYDEAQELSGLTVAILIVAAAFAIGSVVLPFLLGT